MAQGLKGQHTFSSPTPPAHRPGPSDHLPQDADLPLLPAGKAGNRFCSQLTWGTDEGSCTRSPSQMQSQEAQCSLPCAYRGR